MVNIKNDFLNMSEDRYIEIKKMAYQYYSQYNTLDRPSRRKFLEMLPKLNTQLENDILLNTLLFPDTEELQNIKLSQLYNKLSIISKDMDNVTPHSIVSKNLEYNMLNTQKLIEDGKLQLMESLHYPDNSINDKEYITMKKTAYEILPRFLKMPLNKKQQIIESLSKEDMYQAQIVLATLLIPNDSLLMKQLEVASTEDVANHYKVPTSLIEFKKEEYNLQGTSWLIEDKNLPKNEVTRLWYKADLDDSVIYKLWDQQFYDSVEKDIYSKINSNLEHAYSSFAKRNIKK